MSADAEPSLYYEEPSSPLTSVVHVSFSAFDVPMTETGPPADGNRTPLMWVGLTQKKTLPEQMYESLVPCSREPRRGRWMSAIRTLSNADTLLHDQSWEECLPPEDWTESAPNNGLMKKRIMEKFGAMSSGHQIAILTVSRLVQLVGQQTLVLLDEPETHLHPPLLSALVRAVAELVVDRNGVAIVATHSPVVLQEVPRSCAWRLVRDNNTICVSHPSAETFGESVSRLTTEVFGLDSARTGYRIILNDLLSKHRGSAMKVLEELKDYLGSEGRFALAALSGPHTREMNE